MPAAISPLAPESIAVLPVVDGVRLATAAAGIKYRGRTDLMMMIFETSAAAAGVFTRSRCPSAAVDFCRANLPGGSARVVVVNSGNANAFTGKKGVEAATLTAEAAAAAVGCDAGEVFLASTGVIGEPLQAANFTPLLADMALNARPQQWLEAGRAIMTTDTYPKLATATALLGDTPVTINGIAKGSGMIAPDMATMLCFVATDAPVAAAVLQHLLHQGVRRSFNSITVDSDTSTSDTVLAFATGAAARRGAPVIRDVADPRLRGFRAAFQTLLKELALLVVRDGEGARKLIEITVAGASSSAAARRVAQSIANSPLVKTAVAGEDANWGRIVMAIGKAGAPADRDRIAIWFGPIRVAHQGERDPAYSEEAASVYMKRDHIAVRVDLGLGRGTSTVWTCDLTKEYVAINGDYRS